MSWDAYIKNLQMPDSNGVVSVAEAAIWGTNPVGQWASTAGFNQITAEEITVLNGNRTNFRSSGPLINGVKCMLLQDNFENEQVLSLSLKTKSDADGNTYPVCVGRTNTALVIARGFKETSGGSLASKVFGTVDHLRKSNY